MYQWLYDSQRSNQLKSILLLILFPLLLVGLLFWVFYLSEESLETARSLTLDSLVFLIPVVLIWGIISFLFERSLLFSYSGAKVVTRDQEPGIYNIVENLCISRGLSVPKIGIIETPAMNAFALGWKSSDSRIVFTRGLLQKLNKSEIESVAAHELTHIINKDSLLMLIAVVYIGAIAMLWEFLLRIVSGKRSGNDVKKWTLLLIVAFVLLALGYLLYPLIRLAISRKREFLADAGAVELTKDNQAMISALRKISQDSVVTLENNGMAAMFIANPLEKVTSLFQTHPSIEERISALKNY